jgi:hypothetical protein
MTKLYAIFAALVVFVPIAQATLMRATLIV